MRLFRWIVCIPAAFGASVALGALANYVTSLVGGAAWYAWMLSGAASAFAFFWVVFRVAPARPRSIKWLAVAIVALLGATSLAGSVMGPGEKTPAFAGLAMLLMAAMYARISVDKIEREIGVTAST